MLRSVLAPVAAAAIGLTAAVGSAGAQEVIVEEEYMAYDGYPADGYYDPMVAPEASVTVEAAPVAPATRVYGWVAVRPDCGVFNYWNGVRCIDARVTPPDTGPDF